LSEKTKHIDLKYHFVKDHVQLGTIKLRYLPNGDMVADMLTKPLPRHVLGREAEEVRKEVDVPVVPLGEGGRAPL
jgi:hypothetical protein